MLKGENEMGGRQAGGNPELDRSWHIELRIVSWFDVCSADKWRKTAGEELRIGWAGVSCSADSQKA